MKPSIPSLQSTLAVCAGLLVTVALALAAKLTIVASNNGIATLQMMRLIWVLDAFAAVLGGYVAAQIADLRRSVPAPWRNDEKQAAMAAWLVFFSR